jgi:Eukaryotic aspartyl protease
MGGVSETSISSASRYSIDFQFGCQDSETGLFRTQHVDGIMGMSASEDTIPHLLVTQQITKSRIFALCFSIGGGVLTLGGVDQTLHKTGALIQYAKLLKPKGWFTVKLLDVSMRASLSSKHLAVMKRTRTNSSKNSTYSINADVSALNFRKGVIVDSGTTDTYLPISVRDLFEKLFRKLTDGITYTNSNIALSRSQLEKLPTIIYTLEGEEGSPPVEIESEPSSYMERLGDGKFAFRIYLTESAGAILGANVMNNHNVIFDIDNKRIGFVSSECKYENGRNYGTSLMHVDPDPSIPPDSNMSSLELFQKSLSSFTNSLLGY